MIVWLVGRRMVERDRAQPPRFTVLAGNERFEADSFVGIVRQMLERGLSSDAVLDAALATCRRNHATRNA